MNFSQTRKFYEYPFNVEPFKSFIAFSVIKDVIKDVTNKQSFVLNVC